MALALREEDRVLAACWMALGLFQSQIDPAKRVEIVQAAALAQASAQAQAQTAQSREERRRFEEKFNRLVTALEEFQREYNASAGQVWPKKQADALKKAIKDLPLR